MFRGANRLTLDQKFRLAVPTRYREELTARGGGKLVLTIDTSQCLLIYPLQDWEELERKLNKLPAFKPRARALQRLLLGHAQELDLDQSGRVVVPQELRDYAGIVNNVMLIGQGTKFELWDATQWDEQRANWLAEANTPGDADTEIDLLTL